MISLTRIKNGASAEIIACKKNRVISIILLSFAGVIYAFGSYVHEDNRWPYDASFDPSGLAIFIYFCSLTCLYSACTNSFKDTHDRPSADVQMSMPLSSTERYLSRLLTIGYIWFFPFLISAAVGMIVPMISAAAAGYHHMMLPITESLKMLIWFSAAALFIISVTVICQCCTGAKAESKYTPILLMFVLSFAPYITYYMSGKKFGEIALNGEGREFYSFWSFSQLFRFGFDEDWFVIGLLINCLISAAVIAGGMFIYKKRDARTVGRPIVFQPFLEITVLMSLTLLFCYVHDGGFEGIVFFLAWLGSIVLRIICARKSFSIKKIGVWSLLFLLYYALFLAVMFISFKTGCFGELYKKTDMSYHNFIVVSADINICEEGYYYEDRDVILKKSCYCSADNGRKGSESIMDICARYAEKSTKNNSLFFDEMFKSLSGDYYRCTVKLSIPSSGYIDTEIYRISVYLKRDDARRFAEELEAVISSPSWRSDYEHDWYN